MPENLTIFTDRSEGGPNNTHNATSFTPLACIIQSSTAKSCHGSENWSQLMKEKMLKETLNFVELAELLSFSPETIRADITRRPWTLPPFIRVGMKTIWLRATVIDWLKAREQSATPPVKLEPLEPPQPPKRRGRRSKADQVLAMQRSAAA
ncbi:MAG TPA: hypothetical protein VGK14_04400 [Novimethylophilus sp.]|uniref:helix-turn-helix transcriptional regulator n=1 Tax=Novimethylophilus sp. TaxID=2137426 RepID=UPI002F420FCB